MRMKRKILHVAAKYNIAFINEADLVKLDMTVICILFIFTPA